MTKIAGALHYKDSIAVVRDLDVYSTAAEAGSKYLAIKRGDGSMAYAPLVLPSDARASGIRVQHSSGTMAVGGKIVNSMSAWKYATSGTGTGWSKGYAIIQAPNGSCYVTGCFSGTITFGSTTLTCAAGENGYIAKVNPNTGAFEGAWQTSGSPTTCPGYSIAVDAANNCYVTGYVIGTAFFGSFTVTGDNYGRAFIAKLSAAGTWEWVKLISSTGNFSYGYGVTLAPNGLLYVTGYFGVGNITFEGAAIPGRGMNDGYVACIDTSGVWQWGKVLGGGTNDACYKSEVDTNSNVYVTGSFSGSSVFGSTTLVSAAGVDNIFICKLDAAGNWQWAKQATGSYSGGAGRSIRILAPDKAYVSGIFNGSAVFGSKTLTSVKQSYFVARFDMATGNWLHAFGGNVTGDGTSASYGVATAPESVLLTGVHSGNMTIPGLGTVPRIGAAGIFIMGVAHDSGVAKWIATGEGLLAFDMVPLTGGGGMVTGHFAPTGTFGSTVLTTTASSRMFVARADEP